MSNTLEISSEKLEFNKSKVLTEKDIIGLPLGTIIPSAVVLEADSGLHLLNGAVLSTEGLHADFCAWIINKYKNDPNSVPHCSEEEWNDYYLRYSECGKFVINVEKGTVKLPLITEFIASSNSDREIVKEIGTEELDSFREHVHNIPESSTNSSGRHDHDVYGDDNNSNQNEYRNRINTTWTTNYTNSNWGAITVSGNHTHTIPAGRTLSEGNENTKPKNIRYPYYIVVGTNINTEAQIDINKYLSDFNILQNDIVNINRNLKAKVLWENANHNSDFSAQTIELASDDFDYLVWYFKNSKEADSLCSFRTLKGHAPLVCRFDISRFFNKDYMIMAICRLVTKLTDTKFEIGRVLYTRVTSTGAVYETDSNAFRDDLHIPYKIIGYKEIK